ncbi:MAG: phage protein GemA/Gp16 family protein [Deferribacterales bacterium]
MNRVTAKQVQLIHIAKKQLEICDDDYRSILNEYFKVRSSKDLTERQAERLITHFRQKGFRINTAKKAKPTGSTIIAFPTSFQLELIEVLKSNIVWKAGFEGFQLWLEKRMRIKKIRTKQEAAKVIEGLKAMLGIDAEIIKMKSLPFPICLDEAYFIDNFTGEVLPFRWVYDIEKRKLIRIENSIWR